jgi:hypothetical protein
MGFASKISFYIRPLFSIKSIKIFNGLTPTESFNQYYIEYVKTVG